MRLESEGADSTIIKKLYQVVKHRLILFLIACNITRCGAQTKCALLQFFTLTRERVLPLFIVLIMINKQCDDRVMVITASRMRSRGASCRHDIDPLL